GLFPGLAIGIARRFRGDDSRGWPLHAALGVAFVASFFVGARYGQHLGFALRALVCIAVARPLRPAWEFGPGNLRPGLAHLALWILPLGNAWVAIALSVRRAGLHMIFLGFFAALLLAIFTHVRVARPLQAATSGVVAL